MRRVPLPPRELDPVADLPQELASERHLNLAGRERGPWQRRLLLALLALPLLLALLNVFGQRPETSRASTPVASLKVYAPTHLRSGLFFEARFTIEAERELRNATLVLDPGWLEGMTLNTVEPSPIGEASRNGDLALELGHIPAGDRHLFFLQFQVNPTNLGRRSQRVDLYDGNRLLATLDRTLAVWP